MPDFDRVRESLSKQDDALSSRLVEARTNAGPVSSFPGALPESLDQAYAVQAASIARWPEGVAGWKVARLPVPDRERFPAERLAGPVFASFVGKVSAGSRAVMSVYEGGFAAIEAEIVFELGVAVSPVVEERTDEELADLVSAAYCGAEIASSPMPFVIELGAMAIIPDLGINAGVVVGPELPSFQARASGSLATRVSVDGEVVGEGSTDPVAGDPLQALRFLVGHCASKGIELPKGTLVSTGMITGVHDVQVGSVARVDFGTPGWFEVAFDAISRR